MFWSVGWPLLRTEGFFYNLDIGRLGMGKLQFLIKKKIKKIFQLWLFFIFWSLKPWIRIGSGFGSGSGKNEYGSTTLSISQKHGSEDPDPDPPQNVIDPEHCIKQKKLVVYLYYLLLMEGFGSVQITTDPDPGLRGPKTFGSGTGTLLEENNL